MRKIKQGKGIRNLEKGCNLNRMIRSGSQRVCHFGGNPRRWGRVVIKISEKSTCTKALGQETVYKHLMSTNRSHDVEK